MKLSSILVAVDGSAQATKALNFACDLAEAKQAGLILLHVQRHAGADVVPPELEAYRQVEHVRVTEREMMQAAAREIVEDARRTVSKRGLPAAEGLIAQGDPARLIVETANERGVDAIILGSRGLGDLQGLLLGSVSHKVAHRAPCTCIAVR